MSVTDKTKTATTAVGVTDLVGVYTYHNDLGRDGANTQEYALTPTDVNTTSFGKLFSCPVDGAIYAQPLWVAGVMINAAKHNVVYVATQNDSLYAFDADASSCQTLWHANLTDAAHGGHTGESAVPAGPAAIKGVPTSPPPLVGGPRASGDIAPTVGVTGTPVIDPSTGTLYVVSKSVVCSPSPCTTGGQNTFYQRLHAIDITTGNEQTSLHAPQVIAGSYTGSSGGQETFNAQTQNQRPGLALANGVVYIAWSCHEDYTTPMYYGWVFGYKASDLSQPPYVLSVEPDGQQGGIWMGGGAPAADASGSLYLLTGNGPFDATSTSQPNDDYGDSLVKLAITGGRLGVVDYFTPADQNTDDVNDADFGSGGAAIVVNLPAGLPVSQLVLGGGEDGSLYVLNAASLGHLEGNGGSGPWQKVPVATRLNQDTGGVLYSTGAFWNDTFFLVPGAGQPLDAYSLVTSGTSAGMFDTVPIQAALPAGGYGYPGSTPSVSASGAATNGIVWTLDTSQYCLPENLNAQNQPVCGPAVLHAYNAATLAELWNSTGSGDTAGYAVKFTVPTVANGKVYVGTQGTNQGIVDPTTTAGELDVYGLKPN